MTYRPITPKAIPATPSLQSDQSVNSDSEVELLEERSLTPNMHQSARPTKGLRKPTFLEEASGRWLVNQLSVQGGSAETKTEADSLEIQLGKPLASIVIAYLTAMNLSQRIEPLTYREAI